jgi:hypothetical protein
VAIYFRVGEFRDTWSSVQRPGNTIGNLHFISNSFMLELFFAPCSTFKTSF